MQIVIDIDENLYTRLFDNGVDNYDDAVDMAKAIRKGTPLPKGHGRLFDERDIVNGNYDIIGHKIYELEPIIKADKAESEDKSCSNCKYWLLDKNNESRKCKYCFEMDEWVAESEDI